MSLATCFDSSHNLATTVCKKGNGTILEETPTSKESLPEGHRQSAPKLLQFQHIAGNTLKETSGASVTPRDLPRNDSFGLYPQPGARFYKGLGLLHTPRSPRGGSYRKGNHRSDRYVWNGEADLGAIQALLMEQKNELTEVASSYERRLFSLCRAKFAAEQRAQFAQQNAPIYNPTHEVVAKSQALDNVIGRSGAAIRLSNEGAERIESTLSVVRSSQGSVAVTGVSSKAADNKACIYPMAVASTNSMGHSEMLVDFKMTRGWLESTPERRSIFNREAWVKHRHDEFDSACRKRLIATINSRTFGVLSSLCITVHALLTGAATDEAARNPGQYDSTFYDTVDLVFLAVYVVELLLRVAADRWDFIFSGWNIFDLLFITCDAVGHVYNATVARKDAGDSLNDLVAARVIRMLRVLRAFRLLRLMRVFRELRMMVKCIAACGKMAVWVFILLVMNIFIFAIYLTGQVSAVPLEDTDLETDIQETLRLRFGTLTDAWFSLFMSISGGVSWVEFTDPLIQLHWTNGVVMSFFIFFTVFVMLNIITGVFVDGAVSAGRTDEEERLADIMEDENSNLMKIRSLFQKANQDDDNHLSYEELERTLVDPKMRILFKSIGIGVHQVRGLWKLLDVDGSGTVTLDEFITGCMRLRESSTFVGVDLCTLMYENKRMMKKWREFGKHLEEQFCSLHAEIHSLATACMERSHGRWGM